MAIIVKHRQIILSGWTEAGKSDFFKVNSVKPDLIESEIEFQQVKDILERYDNICSARNNFDGVCFKVVWDFWNFIIHSEGVSKRNSFFNFTIEETLFAEQNVFSSD